MTIRKFRSIAALLISVLLCFCMCACGGEGSVEETVEITTPAEDAAPSGDEDQSGDADKNDDADGDSDQDGDSKEKAGSADVDWSPDAKDKEKSDKSEKKEDSQYKIIYKDYNDQMKKATEKYVEELSDMVGSVSNSDLYDETQDRIKSLEKIYDKGKETMVDAMLKSTDDDAKEYKKYFAKMTEKYTEYTREITAAYTDQFN